MHTTKNVYPLVLNFMLRVDTYLGVVSSVPVDLGVVSSAPAVLGLAVSSVNMVISLES